jgi:PAB-dependent poly(A)-specific ribonuclease subunit 2
VLITPAAHLNILEEHSPNMTLTMMIQQANRFFLDKFGADFRSMYLDPKLDHELITTSTQTIRCMGCGSEQVRAQGFHVHDLVYPSNLKSILRSPRNNRHTFSQILKASVERMEAMRGWCQNCRRYLQLQTRRQVEKIPPVFMINANIQTTEAKQLWSSPGFLPKEIGIITLEDGHLHCYQDQDLTLHLQRGRFPVAVYELVGFVAEINSGENEKPHLVSLINGKSPRREENKSAANKSK